MSEKKRGFRRINEETVLAKTGKGWQQWFKVLDEYGVSEHGHTVTAMFLRSEYGINRWWSQAITIRYEWERGMRE